MDGQIAASGEDDIARVEPDVRPGFREKPPQLVGRNGPLRRYSFL